MTSRKSKLSQTEVPSHLFSFAFCSPAKSSTFSGLMRTTHWAKSCSVLTSLGKMRRKVSFLHGESLAQSPPHARPSHRVRGAFRHGPQATCPVLATNPLDRKRNASRQKPSRRSRKKAPVFWWVTWAFRGQRRIPEASGAGGITWTTC